MKRDDPGLEPELEAFLKPRSIERHIPADLRGRALAKARAIVDAGKKIPALHLAEPPRPLSPATGRRVFRIALAASVAVAFGAAGAVAALYHRSGRTPPMPSPTNPRPVPTVDDTPAPAQSREPRAVERAPPPRPNHPARASVGDDGMTAELRLLQRAHAGYTRHDFSGALTLVAEHARRFPRGHLAEQREALRVRSLVGSGRMEEAHHAASAFAIQFPRSVLLPRLEGGPQAPQ